MHYLLPFLKFFEGSWLTNLISDSSWLFPAIEAVHIVALTLLFGAILVLNLRLLGVGVTSKPVTQLAHEFAPWISCGLVIILASGFLLFVSEPMKAYTSVPFQVKMLLLFSAIIFHYTLFRWATKPALKIHSEWSSRAVAVVSVLLWCSVGIAGRGIGFL
jgi:hypothetical protein